MAEWKRGKMESTVGFGRIRTWAALDQQIQDEIMN